MLLSDIREGSNALYCLTDRVQCCSYEAGGSRGRWDFPPNSGSLGPDTTAGTYSSEGFSSILLNRRSSAVGPTGTYSCLMPDAENILRILFISLTSKD